MKKNKINIIFKTIFFCSALIFASCSNFISISENSSVTQGKAKINISLGLKNVDNTDNKDARTVMATIENNNSASSLTDIFLYAKLSSSEAELGSNATLLKTWGNYNEILTSPYDEELDAGLYNFMITAENYGATMTQTLSAELSSEKTTTLKFNSLAPSEDGKQVGEIEINLFYNSNSYCSSDDFKKYISTTSPYNDIKILLDSTKIAEKDSTTYSVTNKSDEAGHTWTIYSDKSTFFKAKNVSSGFHIVTFTFSAEDESIFVYPVPVYVQTGYLSKANLYPFNDVNSVSQDSGEISYTITYNSNTTNIITKTQTFYSTSSLADASALGFKSDNSALRFKEWNTNADGTGTSYRAGTTPAISENTTLYAQYADFKTVTYLINNSSANTDTNVQFFENENSLASITDAFADFDSTKYTFCGWDTKADGSGIRFKENAIPEITEDIILYAQWCGAKSEATGYTDYYYVSDAGQWNALMGAPFANEESGTISIKAYITGNIENPAVSLTKDKTFKGKIYGSSKTIKGLDSVLFNTVAQEAEISHFYIYGPVCNTKNGKIYNITISNVTMTGWSAIAKENSSTGEISNCIISSSTITGSSSSDYVGAICNYNEGSIYKCRLSKITVDGSKNNNKYTGGFCGYNKGRVSECYVPSESTINGSNTDSSYTGGFCGYNNYSVELTTSSSTFIINGSTTNNSYIGGICGYNNSDIYNSTTLDLTMPDSEIDETSHLGYVTGYNATNAVKSDSSKNPLNTTIKIKNKGEDLTPTDIINLENNALENDCYYTSPKFSLNGNTKVYFSLTDSSDGSNTNKETLCLYDESNSLIYTFVEKDTPSVVMSLYLNKGSYYLKRTNNNLSKTSYMNIKIQKY